MSLVLLSQARAVVQTHLRNGKLVDLRPLQRDDCLDLAALLGHARSDLGDCVTNVTFLKSKYIEQLRR